MIDESDYAFVRGQRDAALARLAAVEALCDAIVAGCQKGQNEERSDVCRNFEKHHGRPYWPCSDVRFVERVRAALDQPDEVCAEGYHGHDLDCGCKRRALARPAARCGQPEESAVHAGARAES